jgi:hypothetical protein
MQADHLERRQLARYNLNSTAATDGGELKLAASVERSVDRSAQPQRCIDFTWPVSDLQPCAIITRGSATAKKDVWPGLMRFLDDGRIPLNTNAMERDLRGVVVGRKNSKSERGTQAARR